MRWGGGTMEAQLSSVLRMGTMRLCAPRAAAHGCMTRRCAPRVAAQVGKRRALCLPKHATRARSPPYLAPPTKPQPPGPHCLHGALPTLGAAGLLAAAGARRDVGLLGHRRGAHLLLPGGCLPRPCTSARVAHPKGDAHALAAACALWHTQESATRGDCGAAWGASVRV